MQQNANINLQTITDSILITEELKFKPLNLRKCTTSVNWQWYANFDINEMFRNSKY